MTHPTLRARLASLVALATALWGAGAIGSRAARADDPPPRAAQATLPAVSGWDQEQASSVLQALGLEVKVVTVVHANVGRVVGMVPPAGTPLASVTKVTLQVGTAATARVVVPECVGLPAQDALAMLEPLFACQTVERDAPGQPSGVVLALQPAAGQSHDFRGLLLVTISRSSLTVPSVLGKTELDARAAIQALGLRVEVTQVDEPGLPPGSVVVQDPNAGAAIVPNATVRLRVVRGGGGGGGGTTSDRVRVPELVNLPLDVALRVLVAMDLVAEPTYRPVDTGRMYVVLAQGLLAQQLVARGTRVPFTVSRPSQQGAARLRVPPVVGLGENDAAALLAGAGFRTMRSPRISPLPPGTVVDAQPAEGSEVDSNALVTLFVARAGSSPLLPTLVTVPNLVGQMQTTARQQLYVLGLNAGMLLAVAPDAPVDVVTQQNPPRGTQVEAGTSVTLYVPESTRVPTLDGLRVSEVESLLGGVNLRHQPTGPSTVSGARSIGQTPAAGSRITIGSSVVVQYGVAGGGGGSGGGGGFGRQVTVPEFVGLDQQSARNVGLGAGLSLSMVNIPVGGRSLPTVRSQNLVAGSRVAFGTQVTLDFSGSSGGGGAGGGGGGGAPGAPLTISVPEMRGWSPEQAEQWAFNQGLVPRQATVTPSVPGVARVVTRTEPAAGEVTVLRGDGFRIIVGNADGGFSPPGADTIAVPELAGQTEASARARAASTGMNFLYRVEGSPPAGGGTRTVLRMEPPAGTPVGRSDPIVVVLTYGPSGGGGAQTLVRVPEVVGKNVAMAILALRQARLVERLPPASPALLNPVRTQDPAAGSNVPEGTTVILTFE